MDLKAINKATTVTRKPKRSLKELLIDRKYQILNVKIVKGLYGEVPLVELNDCVVFLPGRVTSVIKENIDHFQSKQYALIYKGQSSVHNELKFNFCPWSTTTTTTNSVVSAQSKSARKQKLVVLDDSDEKPSTSKKGKVGKDEKVMTEQEEDSDDSGILF